MAEARGRAGRRGGGRWSAWVAAVWLFAATGAGAQAVPAPGSPSPIQELTAEASVRLGLEHSPRVRAAEADAAAAHARSREARAGLLPAVRAQASYTRLGGDIPDAEFTLPGLDTTFTILPIERDRYHSEVSVEQPLFAGGRLRQGLRGAEREAAAAEWSAEQERADVALEVRRAYWTLHGAMAALDATDAALAQVEEHLSDVQDRYEEGAVLRSELLAARTRRSEVLLERVESENAVRVARLELNRLVGLPATAEVAPATVVEVEPLPPGPEGLAAEALDARPELLAMAERVSALRAQEAAARGGRLPELSFISRYTYARPNPYVFTEQSEFHGTYEAGFSLRWGLWEGGAQGARAAQARELRVAAEARLEEARELALVDISRQYLEAQRATEAIGVATANVEQAEEALRVTRQQWQEGVALSAQVLEAEAAYRSARAREARAQAEYAISRAALLRALGEVW